MTTKLQRNNLIDQISDYIKDKLANNEWKANDKLPSENELSEELGVSRMSLRAAIQRTNALGLTETRVGDGTYVTDFNMVTIFSRLHEYNVLDSDSQRLSELLSVLQFGALGVIISNGSEVEKLIKKLKSILKKMESLRDNPNLDLLLEYDYEFHNRIIMSSNNEYLILLYEGLSALWLKALKNNLLNSYEYNKSYEYVIGFHHSIIEALQNRDALKCGEIQMQTYKRNNTNLSSKKTNEHLL